MEEEREGRERDNRMKASRLERQKEKRKGKKRKSSSLGDQKMLLERDKKETYATTMFEWIEKEKMFFKYLILFEASSPNEQLYPDQKS